MDDLVLGDSLEALIDHRGKTPGKLGGCFTSEGVPVISAMLVQDGSLQIDEARSISHDMYHQWMPVHTKRHDVILTSEAPLGKVALIPDDRALAVGQRLFCLRGRDGVLDSRYLYYAIQGNTVQNELHARATGTTVAGIRQSELVKIRIPAPTYVEQQAIASLLGALDEKIAANERAAQTAHLLAEARYNDLTAKATRFLAVGDLLDMKYGKALPATVRTAGEVAVYGSGGISGSHNEALVAGPGIIVGRKGTVGTVHWSEKKFFPIDTTFWVELCNEIISMEFAFFLLRSLRLGSMNSNSAVPGLNRNNVLALPMGVPANRELRSFRDAVRPIFQLREAVSAESALLATLRDTLLPKLMSGELRVRDAEKVVEEVT